MLSTMMLMQAGFPLARARSIAPCRSAALSTNSNMAARGGNHLIVAGGEQLTAVHALAAVFPELTLALRIPARVVAKNSNEGPTPAHGGFNSARWNPIVPSPRTANTGASGSRRRAEMAKESEAPIAPATPFTSLRRTDSMLWSHCANSPPSQIRTVSAFRSIGRQGAEYLGRVQSACALCNNIRPRGGPMVPESITTGLRVRPIVCRISSGGYGFRARWQVGFADLPAPRNDGETQVVGRQG